MIFIRVTGRVCIRRYSSGVQAATGSKTPPKLHIKWYYATDIPTTKPSWFDYKQEKQPEKFIPFSDFDSKRLEKRFQQLEGQGALSGAAHGTAADRVSSATKDTIVDPIVEVNEDKLFQVDLQKYILSPVYWEGSLYEVRRGTWFNSDGLPLSRKISDLVEKGYHEKRPYTFNRADVGDTLLKFGKDAVQKFNRKDRPREITEPPVVSTNDYDDLMKLQDDEDNNGQSLKMVLYLDAKYAAIFPDTMNNQFELGVIRNFCTSPVLLLLVEKIQRGYTSDLDETIFEKLPSNPIPGLSEIFQTEVGLYLTGGGSKEEAKTKSPMVKSTNYSDENDHNESKQNSQMKSVLESDYDRETSDSKANRQVDHLILCIHGIGQVLGGKYELVDFTHSINVLRNKMKEVYTSDDSYKKMTSNQYPDNNTLQVLPVSWRHKIDFHPTKNFQLYDANGNFRLPSLSQINVDGVKSLRNIMGDVVLDILLYYEPRYVEKVFHAVVSELNRVYSLYKERNPHFKGKVHILGHSLGSAIAFDIVANQREKVDQVNEETSQDLKFDVDSLFCIGSPVGVFKLLNQRNIRSRASLGPDFDPRDPTNLASSPKCVNLYNLFHPCDPIGYRMEPLVSPRFANFKPEPVPFATKSIHSQIKGLASFGEGIQQKISSASSWFKKDETKAKHQDPWDENALGDILTSLVSEPKTQDEPANEVDMRDRDLSTLTELNRSGRIDYCLPMGVFDISLVSAVSAHVSYFEDTNTAGFLLREVLASGDDCEDSRKVVVYKKK